MTIKENKTDNNRQYKNGQIGNSNLLSKVINDALEEISSNIMDALPVYARSSSISTNSDIEDKLLSIASIKYSIDVDDQFNGTINIKIQLNWNYGGAIINHSYKAEIKHDIIDINENELVKYTRAKKNVIDDLIFHLSKNCKLMDMEPALYKQLCEVYLISSLPNIWRGFRNETTMTSAINEIIKALEKNLD